MPITSKTTLYAHRLCRNSVSTSRVTWLTLESLFIKSYYGGLHGGIVLLLKVR